MGVGLSLREVLSPVRNRGTAAVNTGHYIRGSGVRRYSLVREDVVHLLEPLEGRVVGSRRERVEVSDHVVALDQGVEQVYQIEKSLEQHTSGHRQCQHKLCNEQGSTG